MNLNNFLKVTQLMTGVGLEPSMMGFHSLFQLLPGPLEDPRRSHLPVDLQWLQPKFLTECLWPLQAPSEMLFLFHVDLDTSVCREAHENPTFGGKMPLPCSVRKCLCSQLPGWAQARWRTELMRQLGSTHRSFPASSPDLASSLPSPWSFLPTGPAPLHSTPVPETLLRIKIMGKLVRMQSLKPPPQRFQFRELACVIGNLHLKQLLWTVL